MQVLIQNVDARLKASDSNQIEGEVDALNRELTNLRQELETSGADNGSSVGSPTRTEATPTAGSSELVKGNSMLHHTCRFANMVLV